MSNSCDTELATTSPTTSNSDSLIEVISETNTPESLSTTSESRDSVELATTPPATSDSGTLVVDQVMPEPNNPQATNESTDTELATPSPTTSNSAFLVEVIVHPEPKTPQTSSLATNESGDMTPPKTSNFDTLVVARSEPNTNQTLRTTNESRYGIELAILSHTTSNSEPNNHEASSVMYESSV